jgi:periplasmic copper chaperone A
MITRSSPTRSRMPLIVAGVLVAAACVITLVPRSHDGVRTSDLHVTQPYVPQPASPDVAAAYFTIINSGSRPAVLTSVGSDVSAMSMMHESTGTTITVDAPVMPVGYHPVLPGRGR